MENRYDAQARIFKALCDPRRLQILELLRGGEKCACILTDALGMPQSSLSYHMKILCDSGIVAGREEGKWTHYRISAQGSAQAVALLRELTLVSGEDAGKSCCE